jgi:hypothetical protein
MAAMEPDDQNRPAADQVLIPTAGQGPLCAPYQALVIGARGSIGSAFVSVWSSDPACRLVQTVSRSSPGGFDLLDAESIRRQAQRCANDGLFDLIVDATGALTIEGTGPEKSLRALDSAILTRSMQLNAILHIDHEDWNADCRKILSQSLQRDRLSGTGCTGNKTMAICKRRQEATFSSTPSADHDGPVSTLRRHDANSLG